MEQHFSKCVPCTTDAYGILSLYLTVFKNTFHYNPFTVWAHLRF